MAEKKTTTKVKNTKDASTADKTTTKTKPSKSPKTSDASRSSEVDKSKKSKKGWIAGVIVAAVIVIIGVIVGLILGRQGGGQTDPTAKLSYSDAFFIYDDNKYTLWNAEGKRLTDDEYLSQSSFVAGYAYVKKDDQYGIIRDDGKMTVEYGKYGSITAMSGLYKVQDGNTKEYFLITGDGRVVTKGEKLDIYTAGFSGGAVAVKENGAVSVYNYAGKLVAKVDEAENAEDPDLNYTQDFVIFNYNNQAIVFDARNGEVLASLGGKYEFDTISKDRSILILESSDESGYRLITAGKTYELNETKYYGITAFNNVLGYDSFSKLALLNEDYKVAAWTSSYLELKDYKNYATISDDGKVEIYRNGEKIKEFSEKSDIPATGVLYDDFYAVEENDRASFYSLDGVAVFGRDFKEISSLFDEFHHAVVSDNNDEYYLIDTSGKAINELKFSDIDWYSGGYRAENSDGKYAVVDKKGNLITDYAYSGVSYRSDVEPHNIWTGRNGDKYSIIDADKGKVLLEDVNLDSLYQNYIKVKNSDGKSEYYTYTGEKFYTSVK